MRLRKLSLMAACLTVAGLLIGSCTPPAAPLGDKKPSALTPTAKPSIGQARHGGMVTLATQADPPSFDLMLETSNVALYPIGPAYNLLLREDPFKAGEIIGDLAEKWEMSPDGKTFTFSLRKNVKWHDGKPFSARDAAFSLLRLRDKSGHLDYILKAVVKDAIAVDDTTLRVDTFFPYSQLARFLAVGWAVMMPEHVLLEKGDMKKTVVGTGAFKFKSYQSGVSVQLVKNSDYFMKGLPYLDGMAIYPMRDSSTRLAAFRTKKVKFITAPTLPATTAALLKKELGDEISAHQWIGSYWWSFFMPNDREPWNDVRVRKAVFLAIDRHKSLQTLDHGYGRVGSLLPPEMGGKTDEQLKSIPGFRQPKDADIAEAKKLMAEAGYPNGLKTRILYRKGRQYEDAAIFLKDQLKQIGIELENYAKEDAAFYDTLAKRGFESYLSRCVAEVDDADTIVPQYFRTGAPRNFGAVSDKIADDLIDKQMKTADPTERLQLLGQLEDRLIEMAVQVNLHWGGYCIAWWNSIKDFNPPRGHYNDKNFDHVWISG